MQLLQQNIVKNEELVRLLFKVDNNKIIVNSVEPSIVEIA